VTGAAGVTGQRYADLFVSAFDGLRLYARDYGPRLSDALPVLCLPGLARTSADFHELALALANDSERPRRVLAVDYRGRGRSEYDRNWRNYDLRIELSDLLQVVTVAGVEAAAIVGTSRGGLIAMSLSAARAGLVRAVVLNDVGPVLDVKGLTRIRGYVGKLASPRDYAEGADILKSLFGAQFPGFGAADWDAFARTSWKEADGRLLLNYDPALRRPLEALDLDAPMAPLWFLFAGLRQVPILLLRGANSDLLSAETVQAMAKAHPHLQAITVPGQGHPPALRGPDMIGRIKAFVTSAERASQRGGAMAPAAAP
jgi:pimeloyl-ACP methyl ester carboxylesterase